LIVVRVSVETTASAELAEVCRWLIEVRSPVGLGVDALPAIGQASRLRFDLPLVAPRAVLCSLWLHEEGDPGGCLLAGQLRVVAHPNAPGVRMSFSGHTSSAMRSSQLRRGADDAARQLLEVIAESTSAPSAEGQRVAVPATPSWPFVATIQPR
jgi:hypothetical protein